MPPRRQFKKTSLPNRFDMGTRLSRVDTSQYLAQWFYPLLLDHAGEQRDGPGIVLLLISTAQAYAERRRLSERDTEMLNLKLRDFATAIIDDDEVRADVLAAFDQLGL